MENHTSKWWRICQKGLCYEDWGKILCLLKISIKIEVSFVSIQSSSVTRFSFQPYIYIYIQLKERKEEMRITN